MLLVPWIFAAAGCWRLASAEPPRNGLPDSHRLRTAWLLRVCVLLWLLAPLLEYADDRGLFPFFSANGSGAILTSALFFLPATSLAFWRIRRIAARLPSSAIKRQATLLVFVAPLNAVVGALPGMSGPTYGFSDLTSLPIAVTGSPWTLAWTLTDLHILRGYRRIEPEMWLFLFLPAVVTLWITTLMMHLTLSLSRSLRAYTDESPLRDLIAAHL